jgi:hypothetical protein
MTIALLILVAIIAYVSVYLIAVIRSEAEAIKKILNQILEQTRGRVQ